MRQVSLYPLWLGHVGDARNLRALLDAEIIALIDLALNEAPAVVTRELVYCRFPLLDGAGNPRWLLQMAIEKGKASVNPSLVLGECGGRARGPSPLSCGGRFSPGL